MLPILQQKTGELEEISPISIINKEVQKCFDEADAFFNHRFQRPQCNLKQKGRAAGTAHLHRNELRFNHFMYMQNPTKFLATVIPHEVAHIIVFQIYNNTVKPHGKEWKQVMRKVFNVSPDRTHSFETPLPKVTYEYQCACNTHKLTKRRHNKVQQGTDYICKLCRQTLLYKATIEP